MRLHICSSGKPKAAPQERPQRHPLHKGIGDIEGQKPRPDHRQNRDRRFPGKKQAVQKLPSDRRVKRRDPRKGIDSRHCRRQKHGSKPVEIFTSSASALPAPPWDAGASPPEPQPAADTAIIAASPAAITLHFLFMSSPPCMFSLLLLIGSFSIARSLYSSYVPVLDVYGIMLDDRAFFFVGFHRNPGPGRSAPFFSSEKNTGIGKELLVFRKKRRKSVPGIS